MTSDKSTSTERGEQAEPQEARCVNHCVHVLELMKDGVCQGARHVCGEDYCETGICGHRCITEPPTTHVNSEAESAVEHVLECCARRVNNVHDSCGVWCIYCPACCNPHTGSINLSATSPPTTEAVGEPDGWMIECAEWIVRAQVAGIAKIDEADCIVQMTMPIARIISNFATHRSPEPRIEAGEANEKFVRSVDVLTTLSRFFGDHKREQMKVSDVGISIYQKLTAIDEFTRTELTASRIEAIREAVAEIEKYNDPRVMKDEKIMIVTVADWKELVDAIMGT